MKNMVHFYFIEQMTIFIFQNRQSGPISNFPEICLAPAHLARAMDVWRPHTRQSLPAEESGPLETGTSPC